MSGKEFSFTVVTQRSSIRSRKCQGEKADCPTPVPCGGTPDDLLFQYT